MLEREVSVKLCKLMDKCTREVEEQGSDRLKGV